MEPKIYALNNTTPDMKNWTAQVCVVNKTSPRTFSQSTPIKFQKLLLADEQGRLTDLIGTVTVIFSKHDPRCVSSRGRENTLREYVAIDEAFTPFVITLRNDAVPDDTYNMLDCV
ncbi:hypothetical protein OROHE_015110 [Orobanche hederae]